MCSSDLSPTSMWAGGMSHDQADAEQALMERWNGTRWNLVPSPDPAGSAGDNEIIGIATVPGAARAWTVGTYFDGTNWQPLIEHWNGTRWRRVTSPDPGGNSGRNILTAVAVTSRSQAWAVGQSSRPGLASLTMIFRWNGTSWKRVASPNPGGADGNQLFSVASVSAAGAWAVGDYFSGTTEKTLIEHWNGRSWQHVASPNPGGADGSALVGVAALSPSSAWAVGEFGHGTAERTLIEHWNGHIWKQVASPDPAGLAGFNTLTAVAPVSRTDAWAVGYFEKGTANRTLVEHWNGKRWSQVASPDPALGGRFYALAVVSRSRIWAVGESFGTTEQKSLIAVWNGTTWRQVASPSQ